VCQRELLPFQEGVTYWYWLQDELGLQLAIEKRQAPAQTVNFVGLKVDTVRRRVFMMPTKLEKLLRGLLGLGQQNDASGRELDRVRCRSLHYSVAIRGTRVLATSISVVLGSEAVPDYDARFVITEELRLDLRELVAITQRNAAAGSYLWPPTPASVFAKLSRGEMQDDGDRLRPIFSLVTAAPAVGTQPARTATRQERLLQSWDRLHLRFDRMDEIADRCGKLAAELNASSRARAAARQEQLERVVDRLRTESVRIAESSLQGSFGEVDRMMKDREQDPGDGMAGGGARQATGSTDNEEDMDISDGAEGEP
jgi:hypothetical protein